MNISQLKRLLRLARQAGITLFVWGWHGIGKSDAVRQVAEEDGLGYFDLRCATQEIGDLVGLPLISDHGFTTWSPPAWFPTEEGRGGYIAVEELPRASLEVRQALFQFVLDRRLHTHLLPDSWAIVCLSNPPTEEYELWGLDPALMDRFLHVKLFPEKWEWIKYARQKGKEKGKEGEELDPRIIDYVSIAQPEVLGFGTGDFPLEVHPTPRSWSMLGKMLKVMGCAEGANLDLLEEVASGLLGEEVAQGFYQWYLIRFPKEPIPAGPILRSFPSVQEELQGQLQEGRYDLLRVSISRLAALLRHYELEGMELTGEEEENLQRFVLSLPAEIAAVFVRETLDLESVRLALSGNWEILSRLGEVMGRTKDESEDEGSRRWGSDAAAGAGG